MKTVLKKVWHFFSKTLPHVPLQEYMIQEDVDDKFKSESAEWDGRSNVLIQVHVCVCEHHSKVQQGGNTNPGGIHGKTVVHDTYKKC